MVKKRKRLGWGILGAAKINEKLAPAFAKSGYAELRAIASRTPERAREAASELGIPIAYGCYEELLADPAIDAVYIPLPNTLHAEWTIRAAERGKHVLCEKPTATTADEAQRMVEACARHGVRLMDGTMWPHHPRTVLARRILDSGRIGEVQRVHAVFTFAMRPLDPANIRLQPNLGGGSLLDLGWYCVYAIRWAFSAEPVRAFAVTRQAHGVDIEATALLTFADGRAASFECGFTMPLRQHVEIVGPEGVLWIRDLWLPPKKAKLKLRREGKREKTFVVAGEDQVVHMIDHFSRAVLKDRPASPDPREGVRTLRVLDALARSARAGHMVDV
jgi:predicted dehydrogenase